MDKIEFENMVYEHGPDILRFCLMTAGNRIEGEELYQDTLFTLWRKVCDLDDTEGYTSIKNYALSVAINLWNNYRRKIAWRSRLAPQTSYESLIEDGVEVFGPDGDRHDPLKFVENDETSKVIRDELSHLSPKYRQVIYLRYVLELKRSEIAELLKVSSNTVDTRLKRAKAKLRKRLEMRL